MTDLISRQAAIDAMSAWDWQELYLPIHFKQLLEELPSAQSASCEVCDTYGIEDGDTLYISSDWDGGIGFDYIRDVHYCPRCGRRLKDG